MAASNLNIDLDDLKLANKVVYGRWKTTILFFLAQGPLRFGALRRAVSGISEKVLTAQLRELEADGVVSRNVEPTQPPQVEYAMTEHGRTLCKMIEGMASWGAVHRRYVEAASPPPTEQ
jgi:DNA-binding HxlR family transcriptional regulator